ncbi:hypothetical protein ACFX19_001879 [Malus domestica]
MAYIQSDQELLPYAHEAIPRGDSEQRVLKEGMFEDLSLANTQLRFVSRFLMMDEHVQREIMNHRSLKNLNIIRFKEARFFFQQFISGVSYCHLMVCNVALFC